MQAPQFVADLRMIDHCCDIYGTSEYPMPGLVYHTPNMDIAVLLWPRGDQGAVYYQCVIGNQQFETLDLDAMQDWIEKQLGE